MVATRTPIADLSADGSRVGLIVGWTGADCDHVVIWTPAARALNRFRKPSTSCPEGVSDLELAGSRAAWATVSGCGNFCDVKLESATLDNPAPVWVLNDTISHGEQPDYSLRGDGDLLVFNLDGVVRIDSECGPGHRCKTLRTGPHTFPVESVSGHLIAVREATAVAVLDDQGSLVNVLPFGRNQVKAARVDGSRVIVARSGVLEIYEIRSALEPELMRRAVAALQPADVKRLVDMSEQMDARVDKPAAGLRARRAFYGELYAFADRPRVRRLILGLRDDVQRYHVLKNVAAALHDHAEIRDCIRVKDAERAAQIHSHHLRRACADLVDVLEREGAL